MLQFERLPTGQDLLGECPLWDDAGQCLYWVDSRRHLVRRLDPASGAQQQWELPHEIGSIALCGSGRLLVALVRDIVLLDTASGAIAPLTQVSHAAPSMRLNDGRTDRAGRFLVGSLIKGSREPLGAVYQLAGDSIREVARGVCVSNSTCFSPDGRWMYFADSLADRIWRYSYDTASGAVGAREDFIDTSGLKSGPDGAAVDAEGALWVALVMTGQVARFLPDGQLDRVIDCPVPYVSCPCFGGPQLDTLYLTSISDSGNLLKSAHPDAGALLAVHGTGARGLAEVRFRDADLRL